MNNKTQLLHSGVIEDQFGSLTIPIYQSSAFEYHNFENGKKIFSGEENGYVYSRMRNPTISMLETQLANMEGAEQSLAVSSGMSAISSVLLSLLDTGDELAIVDPIYGGTQSLCDNLLVRMGIKVAHYADVSDLTLRANPNTRVIFFESISNPTVRVNDIHSVVSTARNIGAITVCDNTFLSPAVLKPIELGIDIVIHSATKYLSGHGDIIAGVISGSDHYLNLIRGISNKQLGSCLGPQEAYLLHRGLRTLSLRMEQHQNGAFKVAEFLAKHPLIARVYFPGLETESRDDKNPPVWGAMVSFELRSDLNAVRKCLDSLVLFKQSVSLGDLESLACHPATTTHSGLDKEQREKYGITDKLIRLSIGVEHPDDLIADLSQAIALAHDKVKGAFVSVL